MNKQAYASAKSKELQSLNTSQRNLQHICFCPAAPENRLQSLHLTNAFYD